MTGAPRKQAVIAFGTELVDYQGSADSMLRVRLASGEDLAVTANQLQLLCEIAARCNPLLDPPLPDVADWLCEHARDVFGRILNADEARRILGVLAGEGFLQWGDGGYVGHFRTMPLENALDACVGCLCFYGERGFCAPVRLARAVIDDCIIKIELSALEFSKNDPAILVDRHNFCVGIKRSGSSIYDGCLVASYYVNWILVTAAPKVERLISYFRSYAETRAMFNEVRRIAHESN